MNGTAALSAAVTYYRKKMVDVRTAIPLLVASTAAAPFGALLTNIIPVRYFSGILAAVILAAAYLVVALAIASLSLRRAQITQ